MTPPPDDAGARQLRSPYPHRKFYAPDPIFLAEWVLHAKAAWER